LALAGRVLVDLATGGLTIAPGDGAVAAALAAFVGAVAGAVACAAGGGVTDTGSWARSPHAPKMRASTAAMVLMR
jgi:hypothetical protein